MVRPDSQNLPKKHSMLLKTLFDRTCALFGLIVLSPVLLAVAILIRAKMPGGPVIFKQTRIGRYGKPFTMCKFRSMTMNHGGSSISIKGENRITPLGSVLRKYKLDELPELWNVLKGDMSIVGPRPHMLKHTEEYSKLINKYMVRHWVKPGITGWSQVSGFRGETKALDDMENRIRNDIWYIEHWSFMLDIYIIFKTVANSLRGEDKAY